MCQVNGKTKNSTPTASTFFNQSFWNSKPSTISGLRPRMQNLVDVGWREGGLRKWRILAYFWFFLFFVLFTSHPDHTVEPITTSESSKRVFLRKKVPFGLDDKKWSLEVKTPQNMILGAWIGILSQIYELFKSRYLKKVYTRSTRNLKGKFRTANALRG